MNAEIAFETSGNQTTIIPKPPGYQDSPDWNYESVERLLELLQDSEAAAPVLLQLRRVLKPTRRIMMSWKESFQFFPSLAWDSANHFYYDIDSEEDIPQKPLEDGVIVVSNPVESMLPSAQISINMLKDIMVARAIAARSMVPTPRSTIPWMPMNKTTRRNITTTAQKTTTTKTKMRITTTGKKRLKYRMRRMNFLD